MKNGPAVAAFALVALLAFLLLREVTPRPARAHAALLGETEPSSALASSPSSVSTLAAPSPDAFDATPGSKLAALDRAKRDAMRTLIWQSFGQEPPDAAPPPKAAYVLPVNPPWPEGPSDAGPGIDPKYIQEKVRGEFFPLAIDCYQHLTKRVPDAGGTVHLAFDIVGNQNIGGVVEQVDVLDRSTLRDPEFVDCMRQSFLGVTFPPPDGNGMVTVEYPIQFDPGDGDDDD